MTSEGQAASPDDFELYRAMYEQAAVGLAHVGIDGKFIKVNRHLCELFQYSQEELLQRTWADLTHPSDLSRNTEHVQKMLSGEHSTYCTQKRYIRRDGKSFWADLNSALVRTPEGQPKYFLTVIVDISQRKHAEELLSRSEQRLQSILDHTTAVVYIKDASGRYEVINRRFEEIFNTTAEKVMGRTDFEIFPQEWAQRFRSNDVRVLESQLPMELEEIAQLEDGIHTYISIKVPIIDATGRSVAICGISTDITERKRAEEQMARAKEAAEQASKAKSRFLANISHEIRTPIMAILGTAEMIHGGGLNPDQISDHGEVVLRSGRHLLSLVDDLLDQSRIDAGRMEVSRAPCSLPEILADVHAVTAPLIKSPIEFRIIYKKDVPEQITTDRKRLTQAVINVVHNAIKFTTRGHVHVKVAVELVEQSPFLTICVEDTGEGIAHTDLNRIFEPFTQLSGSTQNLPSGMGLGLPLARWIAQRLGGGVQVRSEPGIGSVFSLRIPVGPLGATPWLTPDEATSWSQAWRSHSKQPKVVLSGSVLVAEDSAEVRSLLKFALERTGVSVEAVADGFEAIQSVKTKTYDLILLDIRMPHVDGMQAAQAIRELQYAGPLIALTASTAQTERDSILAAGFDDLWPKPISLERLVELASAYLQSTPPVKDLLADSVAQRLSEVRADFAKGLPDRMERLRKALEAGDQEAVKEILHQLVGSSGTVGFMDLSAQATVVSEKLKTVSLSSTSPELLRLYEVAKQANSLMTA